MAKNILILNGATRVNGNTDNIINKICDGIEDPEIQIEKIVLRKQKINDCKGCDSCLKKGICSIQDDMNFVNEKIKNSELIIFASPIYWWGVTGIMKNLIDRLYLYNSSENARFIEEKKAIVIAPMNMKQHIYKTKLFIDFFNILFENLKIQKINMYFFDNISDKGAFQKRPDYIEQAISIGKSLSEV